MRVNSSGNSPVQGTEVSGAKQTDRAKAAQAARKDEKPKETSAAALEAAKPEISSKAKELAHAKEIADSAPDVREEKIAALKAKIAAGKYKVDADAVADRMVDEHLKAGIG